ncbi:RabGAP/TBC [Rhizopus microsporus var. microsporus]|nr:RabGAP/TBC [Rhizopus microsporus var. microsporus]
MTTIVHSDTITKETTSSNTPFLTKKDQEIQTSSNTISDITYSDDDDSTCTFDSLEDDKLLLTPPMEEEEASIEELNEKEDEHDVDWEFWSKVISNYSQFTQSETKRLSAQVVQHGIPSALRGTIWPLLTNTSNLQGLQEVYIQLLRQESVYEKAITRDLHRTFPHHPYFQSTQGQEALFNVVKAYSIYDPEVGYCQGLAFVAGPLLLNMPEEEAFCMLVQLLEKYKIRGQFTPQLDLLRLRLHQFDGLLQDHLPHIHRHFNEQGIRSNMYASQWFLTLFAYKFPLKVVYRIYDILFTEGANCLFRIGLALLAKNQANILSLDFDSLVTYLKDDMLDVYEGNVTDLLSESHSIIISQKRLEKLAKDYQIESTKADNEACLIQSLKKENRLLAEKFKNLSKENQKTKEEHAQAAKELEIKSKELTRIQDERDALRQQNQELKQMVEQISIKVESHMQSDMEKLYTKNQLLTQKNAQLQDQLADMENVLIEIKLKYALSESEREKLSQRLCELKKCVNSTL